MPAIGKTIRTEKIIGTWRRGDSVLRNELFAQQPPRRQHESDGGSQHRKAEWRPTEEIERREAALAQLTFDNHVGRGCDQGYPLISAASDNGMSMRLLFKPVFLATFRTKGMNMATIAEELINAPMPPASVMMSTIKRVSLPPPNFITASPRRCTTPEFTSASPTIKIAAIRITTGSPKPASASCGVSTRVNMSANTTRMATMSTRGRPQANSTTAPASMPKTISICSVMAARPQCPPHAPKRQKLTDQSSW